MHFEKGGFARWINPKWGYGAVGPPTKSPDQVRRTRGSKHWKHQAFPKSSLRYVLIQLRFERSKEYFYLLLFRPVNLGRLCAQPHPSARDSFPLDTCGFLQKRTKGRPSGRLHSDAQVSQQETPKTLHLRIGAPWMALWRWSKETVRAYLSSSHSLWERIYLPLVPCTWLPLGLTLSWAVSIPRASLGRHGHFTSQIALYWR